MCFKEINKWFFILVLSVITWIFFEILSTYFSVILWATILSVIFNPVKNWIYTALGNRNVLASILTIGIICLIVFVPLVIMLSYLVIEMNILYTKLTQNNIQFFEIIAKFFLRLPNWVNFYLENHNLIDAVQIQKKFSEFALQSGQYLAGSAFLIGKGTFSFAISFAIMLYLLFFLLKDGPFLTGKILNCLPLSRYMKQHLFTKFVAVLRATVKGTVVTAVVQGILGGVAFYVAGIDGSILWVALIMFLSLIPAIGSSIIWIPVAIYLFANHQLWQGFFIVGYFIVIIGLIDNILRPLLVGKDAKMPDYLVLITTLGGMKMYGINGFVSGPLIAALFIACWDLLFECDYVSNID